MDKMRDALVFQQSKTHQNLDSKKVLLTVFFLILNLLKKMEIISIINWLTYSVRQWKLACMTVIRLNLTFSLLNSQELIQKQNSIFSNLKL